MDISINSHSPHYHWTSQSAPIVHTITRHVTISPPQTTPLFDMSQSAPIVHTITGHVSISHPQTTPLFDMSQSAPHSPHHHWTSFNQPPTVHTITRHVSISSPQSTLSPDKFQSAPPLSTPSLDMSQSGPHSPNHH